MDTRTQVNRRPDCGATLLEVVICLIVLGLVLAAFGDNVQRAVAAETMLEERGTAEELMTEVRAMLAAEDPFVGPRIRSYSRADGVSARASAVVLCSGPELGVDDGSSPTCANGSAPVRRWTITVRFPSTTTTAARDSLVSVMDVASPSLGAGWTTATVTP
jgi:type II secretory pathway pseudopilin PulG